VEHLEGALLGKASNLFANIKLGSKDLPGTNIPVYNEHSSIKAFKSCKTLNEKCKRRRGMFYKKCFEFKSTNKVVKKIQLFFISIVTIYDRNLQS
jgi:hypothetical protein